MNKIIYLLLFISIVACKQSTQNTEEADSPPQPSGKSGKELAELHCASCHAYPEPSLLDKKSWMEKLLPNMGARLGIKTKDYDPYKGMEQMDVMMIQAGEAYPEKPRIAQEDWDKIVQYYQATAPEKLDLPKPNQIDELKGFTLKKLPKNDFLPIVTMAKIDAKNQQFYLGTLDGSLRNYDKNLKLKKQYNTLSPSVGIMNLGEKKFDVLLIGQINPNEQQSGEFVNFDGDKKLFEIGELKRPVDFIELDINKDGKNEIFVAEYGYEWGLLSWYEKRDNQWKRHLLSNQAGASRILANDFNKDGLIDLAVLFGQGDEHISIFYNKNYGEFEEKRVLRFPPVYGSSDLQLIDFNKDGYMDLLYANGDNADFSPILKPYHGVRIYLNDKKDNFKETYFYPFNGAFRAKAADFDLDGDEDIVVSSFFPSDETNASDNFLYLEQTSSMGFSPKTFKQANLGKWMTMDVADIDNDGDLDILLGSFMLSMRMGERQILDNNKTTPFVILENQSK
jgi:hypothetical protein